MSALPNSIPPWSRLLEFAILQAHENLHSYLIPSSPGAFFGPTVLAAFSVFLIYYLVIWPNFFCPTRHLPGPYYSKVSLIPQMYYGYHRKSNENIRNLHLKYGNTVRVAPYIVSFDAPETIPQIYGVRSPFPKDWSAAKMDNFGAPCSFSTPLNADHRRRRNRFAAVYSKSSVTTGEGYQNIAKRTNRVLQKITENALKGLPTDIYWLFHYYTIDNVSLMASGTDTRLLHGENTKLSQDLRTGFDGLAYAWYFFLLKPFLALSRDLTEKLVPPRFVKAFDAHEAIREHNLQHYHKARDAEKEGKSEYNKSVLSKLQTHKDYQSPDLTEMHVASEISDHLLAGADTLVVGLTYLFWELALPHNGPILRRLQEELDTVGWDADGTPASYADVDALPYLELVYREALRVHAVSGNIQSRYVPEEGIVLNGHVIPKGIELGHPLYATMLNPEVFEDPKRFWPERWEEMKDGARLERMKAAWIPFGYGARICVGRELALCELKLLVSTIIHKFDVKLDPTQDPEEMEMVQAAVMAPKGARCPMIFDVRQTCNPAVANPGTIRFEDQAKA